MYTEKDKCTYMATHAQKLNGSRKSLPTTGTRCRIIDKYTIIDKRVLLAIPIWGSRINNARQTEGNHTALLYLVASS